MKNLIKITAVSSLLVIVCLLISACGGDTERAARNEGDVRIAVTDSSNNSPLAGVTVQVREDAGTGTLTNLGTTDADGHLTYTGTADHVYYFTLSKTGYTTQTDIASPTLLWSDTGEINVILNKL
ncbi:MAG: hypothetical protein CVU66_00070 [Deltaproteobacteria bacterium HGW-Deltaproteobacteria-23]|jgi:hypothetical protein|nr:MAG: hypothetical protein CVU66_00070 [Deltaproteobacteria bacterium HGW-Deltaproteobacteria-23]